MKKYLALFCLALVLTGCSRENRALNGAMDLRQQLLSAEGCSFEAKITADYGDAIHSFSVSCRGDRQGGLQFTVREPESISGITGTIDKTGGQLTFTETALQFDLLTDRQLSPVSAPWIFLRTLREGYLMNGGEEDGLFHVEARDSYEDQALHVDLWLSQEGQPTRGEILFGGRRILTLEVRDFTVEHAGQV